MSVLFSLLLAAAPGTRFAPILWNGPPAERVFIDLGVVVLKAAGPGVADDSLEHALAYEAQRLNADAFVFTQAEVETVYVPGTKTSTGDVVASVRALWWRVVVAGA